MSQVVFIVCLYRCGVASLGIRWCTCISDRAALSGPVPNFQDIQGKTNEHPSSVYNVCICEERCVFRKLKVNLKGVSVENPHDWKGFDLSGAYVQGQ